MSLLQIGQEISRQSQQRRKRHYLIHIFNAIGIGKITQYGTRYTGYPKGKAEEKSRNQSDFIRQQFLRIHQNGRKSRRSTKPIRKLSTTVGSSPT